MSDHNCGVLSMMMVPVGSVRREGCSLITGRIRDHTTKRNFGMPARKPDTELLRRSQKEERREDQEISKQVLPRSQSLASK